jgi:hypothetical protein
MLLPTPPIPPALVSPPSLEEELKALLNKHSAENVSGTPDFILATFLIACLDAHNAASNRRVEWYGAMDSTFQ